MPTILVPDSLRLSVEAASGGKVTVLYDDQKNPSFMRRFAPMTIKELYRQYFDDTDDDDWDASASLEGVIAEERMIEEGSR